MSGNVSPIFWRQCCRRWLCLSQCSYVDLATEGHCPSRWSLIWCCYIRRCPGKVRCCSALVITCHSSRPGSLELENCLLPALQKTWISMKWQRCNFILRSDLLLISDTYYSDFLFSYQFSDSTFCDIPGLGFVTACPRHWFPWLGLTLPLTLAVALCFKTCMRLSIRLLCGREYERMINF